MPITTDDVMNFLGAIIHLLIIITCVMFWVDRIKNGRK